jgi:oxygen-independent coproporphyrinogen-3 oxidase
MPHDTSIRVLRQRPAGSARPVLEAFRPGGSGPARSLYVHIPFCFHKCHYCDFYSIVDARDRQGAFTCRLIRELHALAPWARGGALKTIFVGGGTPSLLRPDLWRVLLEALHASFDLSHMGAGPGEFTVECNPETVTDELMAVLASGGVNRVSVGAQSFNPRHLKTLERWHDPANVPRALEMARRAGIGRQSVDLIFGIPGQTLEDWETDLASALALGVEHLSCYNLTYEAGTAMTARLARGEFSRADEDLEVEMYALTLRTLRGGGLHRYEVSNYARPGAEARHNLAYWRQEQWLAAGPSASGHLAGHRWKNSPRLDDYLEGDDEGFAPVVDHEPPDAARSLRERIMTGLRLAEGLDSAALLADAATIDPAAPARLRGLAAANADRGLLLIDPASGRWRLTDSGFLLADGIAADFMAAIR